MPSEEDLVGVWSLTSHYYLNEDGSTDEGPLGAHAVGLLIYEAHGYISVGLMRVGGGRSDSNGPHAYMGYSGRWRIADGVVIHDVRLSSHPHVIGTAQVREARVDRGLLTLRERIDETPCYFVLCWHRE